MAWTNPGPMASQIHLLTAVTSGSTCTVTIPAGPANAALEVIDNIIISGVSGTSGTSTLTVNGNTILQVATTLNVAFAIQLDFSAGWPQWTASGSDLTPVGSNNVTLTMPGTISNATTSVCLHYVNPGVLRN